MDEAQTKPYRSVDIQIGSTEYLVSLGSSVVVPFAVTNYTGQDSYFDIQIHGIPETWLLLDLPVMRLGAGERRQSSLTIQAPANSPVSVGDYPVTLLAISQQNTGWQADAQFLLRVKVYDQTVQAATVESSERVGLTMSTTQFAVAPGEMLTIPVVIANRGLREDTFTLRVEGLAPDWVSTADPYIRLLPGEHRETQLHISPSLDANSRAGRHPFALHVTALSDPTQTTYVEALLTMAAINQFAISLAPVRVDAGNNARVTIYNRGNVQDSYSIRFQGTDVELDFVPSVTGPIRLLPGESASVEFAVSPHAPNWFGSQMVHSYTVFVQSAGGGTQVGSGEVVSLPLIPVWVLPALALFCLTSFCALGFLWNWNQNRLTLAQETREAQVAMLNEQTATAASVITSTADALATVAAGQTATTAATLNVPTDTAVPTSTATITPTETPLPTSTFTVPPSTLVPTLPPIPATPAPTNTIAVRPTNTPTMLPALTLIAPTATLALPTATTAPQASATATATSSGIALPVTGEQIIVFTSNREGSPSLYMYNSEGGTLTALMDEPGTDTQPTWSPDGNQLLFTSERDGNNEIYVINLDGTGLANLTNSPANDRYPAWSPDGEQIAFTSDRDGNDEIYVMNIDGTELSNVSNHPAGDVKPAWFEQSGLLTSTSRILFSSDRDGNDEIYALTIDSETEPVNLTNNPASDTLPAVPYEGGPVAFVTDRDGNLEIYTMGQEGEDPTNLTNNPAADSKPVWSRDGSWVAFTTDRDGNREIYIMGADGSELTNITRSPADDIDPAWR